MIQIFNLQLNGADADKFCKKSATEKFAWIQKRVPDVTESQIDDFLSKELKHQKTGCGCSPTSRKDEQSKSSGVPKAVVSDNQEPIGGEGIGNGNERRRKKNTRNKKE